jgi:hypothetical protein
MGYEKLGSDQAQLAGFGGGVISEEGAVLLSGDSTGEQSLLFGSAALREIQAGVANGDFAITPLDPLATIVQDGNPLPYWTFTDVNSAGAITAAIVADAGAASGNVLRFTVASGTQTGKSATLTRFIPVASSASRSFSFYAEATFDAATNSTQANAKISCQFYKSDQITTTGTAFESALYTFDLLQLPTGATAPDFYVGTPDLAETTAPADAAFLRVTITIATVATQSAARTVDLTEVRVGHGLPELILTDKSGGSWPAYIINNNDTLSLYSSSQSGVLDLGDATNLTGLTSVDIYSGDLMNITTGATGLTIDSGNTVEVLAPGGVIIYNDITGAGVTTDLTHGITLQRTANLTLNTSVDASATAITWSSAVKNTSLYAYWSTGSTIAIPLSGWYSITCHLISGTGLGTGFAFRLYALVNGVVIAETETQAGANTTSDTFTIATIAYMSAGNSLVFRASASSASKTIGGSRRSACSVVYLGNTSA